MCRHKVLLFGVLFLCFVGSASADIYDVTIDTSSIAGTAGSLDFNFNPGPLVTQAASLQILNFSSDGSLAGSPILTGDVSGALPATVTFDNGTAFNDYFGGFTFGKTISFDLSLYGPAVSSPDGVSTSGSAFAFSMFSDAAGTVPVLTADATDGFAFVVNANLDGSTTPTVFSAQTAVVPQTSATPEPSLLLVIAGLTIALVVLRLRRRVRLNVLT